MSYNVKSLSVFERQAKRLIKKYPSLKNELLQLITSLKTTPQLGTPLGHECYKIRLAIASKGKGKSGGARVITHIAVTDKNIFLLSIYDKSEKDNLSGIELDDLLQEVPD